jgi:uncharacterized protein Veg
MPIKIKQRKRITPETTIKKQVKQYLSLKGWFHFPILQGLGAYPGIPDIIAMKRKKLIKQYTYCDVLFIEVKSERGKQSTVQKNFQAKIEEQYGSYLVVRSVDDLVDSGI